MTDHAENDNGTPICRWADIREHGWNTLFLGNGASIAISTALNYKSLYAFARGRGDRITADVDKLFARLGERNSRTYGIDEATVTRRQPGLPVRGSSLKGQGGERDQVQRPGKYLPSSASCEACSHRCVGSGLCRRVRSSIAPVMRVHGSAGVLASARLYTLHTRSRCSPSGEAFQRDPSLRLNLLVLGFQVLEELTELKDMLLVVLSISQRLAPEELFVVRQRILDGRERAAVPSCRGSQSYRLLDDSPARVGYLRRHVCAGAIARARAKPTHAKRPASSLAGGAGRFT